MKLRERFRRLTLWNKIGVLGSVASIVGLALVLSPRSPLIVIHFEGRVDVDRLADELERRLSSRLHSAAGAPAQTTTPAPASSEVTLLLVDTSGSMTRYPVRQAIAGFASAFTPDDVIGLTAFSESAIQVLPLSNYAAPTLERAIATLSISGRFTDLRGAIAIAARALANTPPRTKRLVLFTDGVQEPPMSNGSQVSWQFEELSDIGLEVVLFGSESAAQLRAVLPQARSVTHWPGG